MLSRNYGIKPLVYVLYVVYEGLSQCIMVIVVNNVTCNLCIFAMLSIFSDLNIGMDSVNCQKCSRYLRTDHIDMFPCSVFIDTYI